METAPYLSKRQLLALISDGYLIDVVSLADAHKTAAVWYGEWVIQVPEQRGEPERFLVSVSNLGAPKLRTCKTANGLISLMQELGFDDVTVPMKEGRSASHQLQSSTDREFRDLVEDIETQEMLIVVKNGLRFLSRNGFVPVRIALALIEAGYARPVALHVQPDGEHRHSLDAIRLTDAGATAAGKVEAEAVTGHPTPETVPEWQRVVTEDYIHTKARDGIYVSQIVCARNWYGAAEIQEYRLIRQPPVQRTLRRRPWAGARV